MLFIDPYFVFPDELKVVIQLLGGGSEDFSHLVVTRLPYIIAHFNNELDMSTAVFKIFTRRSITLSFQDLNVFFDIDQVGVNTINFLLPF